MAGITNENKWLIITQIMGLELLDKTGLEPKKFDFAMALLIDYDTVFNDFKPWESIKDAFKCLDALLKKDQGWTYTLNYLVKDNVPEGIHHCSLSKPHSSIPKYEWPYIDQTQKIYFHGYGETPELAAFNALVRVARFLHTGDIPIDDPSISFKGHRFLPQWIEG